MDCMEGMRLFPDKHFGLAIVDPPYGIGVNHSMGRRKGQKCSNHKKVRWDSEPPTKEYFIELRRVSKNQIIWGANHFISRIPIDSPCWIVWDKKYSENVSFASVELAWTSFISPAKRYAVASNRPGRIHPTQKPVELYKWLIGKYANKGDIILDTHVGSASSLIACHDMSFDFIGFEIDEEYFALATNRLAEHQAQLRFDLDT